MDRLAALAAPPARSRTAPPRGRAFALPLGGAPEVARWAGRLAPLATRLRVLAFLLALGIGLRPMIVVMVGSPPRVLRGVLLLLSPAIALVLPWYFVALMHFFLAMSKSLRTFAAELLTN